VLTLLILFVAIPAVELALLIEVGARIGTLATLGLILATGVLGASLARWQGLAVLATIRRELEHGRVPAGPIMDGVIILIAAAVLMTPGLLTDAFGVLCLAPATRRLIKAALRARFEAAMRTGQARVHVHVDGTHPRDAPRPPVIDVTPGRDPRSVDQ